MQDPGYRKQSDYIYMSNPYFVLHAPNIHCGGGLALLKLLIEVLPDRSHLIVDDRCPIPESALTRLQVHWVKPTLWHRLGAELRLKQIAMKDYQVLCFGNLPPLFKLKSKAALFLQNKYLIDAVVLLGFPIKVRIRILMERLWLKVCRSHIDKIIVQTPSMQKLLKNSLSLDAAVLPFATDAKLFSRKFDGIARVNQSYEFVYVASGEPHKNHLNLIKAWSLLAQQEIYPSLTLTLSEKKFSELVSWIEQQKREYSMNVFNLGLISEGEIQDLYLNATALIFPSTLESFGIPLIAARDAGLAIVASELDYVRDIVDPEVTFDPASPLSIARAVKRFLGEKEETLRLLDARGFLDTVFKD